MALNTTRFQWMAAASSALTRWTRPKGAIGDPLRYWQERVLRTVLLSTVVFGSFVYAASVWLSLKERLWSVALVDTLVYGWLVLVLVRDDLPYRLRSGSLVFVSYLLGCVLLGVLGPYGAGPVWLFAFPVLAGTLMGPRASLAALAVNGITLVFVGAAIGSGHIRWPIPDANPVAKWWVSGVNFLLLDAVATVSISVLLKGLRRSLAQEKELRTGVEESEARLRTIIETVHAGILIIDAGSMHIVDLNSAAAEMIGVRRETLTGRSSLDFLDDGVVSAMRRSGEDALQRGMDTCLKTDGGGCRPVLLTLVPVMLDRRSHWLASFIDRSDLRRAEMERSRLETQLAQARKMEALGTLAGGIAHDFNNILMALMGYTELAMVRTGPESQVQKDLQAVFQAGQRARELVQQILAFSRRDERRRAPARIQGLVTEALDLFRAAAPPDVDIRTAFAGDPVAMIDATQFHQVLMNLLTNARHALKAGGGVLEVGIAAPVAPPPSREAFSVDDTGRWLRVWVSDDGCGIPDDVVERIFEPFFTTRQVGEGTGMGLSVVHGIVRGHGGEITVESTPGAGTRMNVFLPMADTAAVEDTPAAAAAAGTERILLVDDDESVLAATAGMLRSLGYTVAVESGGAAAVARIRQRPAGFDLVLTDVNMPEMTGMQLLEAVSALRPSLPVILITGNNGDISGEKAREMGAAAIAVKPLMRSELAELLRTVLDRG